MDVFGWQHMNGNERYETKCPTPLREKVSLTCNVEAAESLVSVRPVPLGKLDTTYRDPFGTGCLTTSFPFLVSAKNILYQ